MKTQHGFRTSLSTTGAAALLAFALAGGAPAASVSTNGLVLADITHPEAYNPAMVNITGTTAVKGVGAAFDNDFKTDGGRWLVQSKSCWVAYEFEEPTVVNAYGLWNSTLDYSVAARAPKTFQFLGSNDGTSWTTLDAQTDETGWTLAQMRLYRFDNATAYTRYKFNVSANNNDNYTQLHEIEFYNIVPTANLEITGHPAAYGTSTPAYGTLADVAGQTFNLSVQSVWTNAQNTVRAFCTGWKVYTNNTEDAIWTLIDQGSGNAATFTHPNMFSRFAWQFAVSNAIVVTAFTNGTASGTGWYGSDQTVTATATPVAGYRFGKWIGAVPAGMEKTTPLQFAADTPRSITAVFWPEGLDEPTQFVSTSGSDGADGYSTSTAKKTIAAAVQVLNAYGEVGGIVRVFDGWYPVKNSLTVTNPIVIRSESGDRGRVVVTNTVGAGWFDQDHRVFILDHADAVLSGLTIANGQVEQRPGGNVWIKTGGGTVTNCVLDKGYARNYDGTGAGIRMEAGLLTHSVVRRSGVQQNGNAKATAIHASGSARISNCLVLENSSSVKAHAVYLTTATMANCTIVGNTVTTNAGWAAVSADSKSAVVNTAIAGTIYSQTGAKAPNWAGTASVFQNCATDDAAAINATCLTGTVQTLFRNYAAGNYRPGDPLIDQGASLPSYPAFDLAGKPRVQGSRIDIGCYEGLPSGSIVVVR